MKSKVCTMCGIEKPLEEFRNSKGKYSPGGKLWWCKACCSLHEKEYRARPDAKIRRAEYQEEYKLQTSYGITKTQKLELLEKQNNMCAICGKELEYGIHTCVDHSHVTGKVRGILCRKCNLALGYIEDNLNIAQNIVAYLNQEAR